MHTDTSQCLNCGAELKGAYCYKCGQKASTHRFSASHFVAHEMVHGIWHLDKGVLLTLRHVLVRPGKFTREYIAGKRVGHFSLVTLLVLLVGSWLFVVAPLVTHPIHIYLGDESVPGIVEFLGKTAKWALLIIVPVMARSSKDIFKMLRYNYTEHMVMNGFFYAGMLCFSLVLSLLYYIPGSSAMYITGMQLVVLMTYVAIAYRQATRHVYVPGMFARLISLFFLSVFGNLTFVLGLAAVFFYLQSKI